jgi:hypothetical protein
MESENDNKNLARNPCINQTPSTSDPQSKSNAQEVVAQG